VKPGGGYHPHFRTTKTGTSALIMFVTTIIHITFDADAIAARVGSQSFFINPFYNKIFVVIDRKIGICPATADRFKERA